MRWTALWLAVLGAALCATGADAQRRRPFDDRDRPGAERLERFRKMRLVEELNLGEEEAVRFFARQAAHEEKVRAIMKARNEALDGIERAAGDGGDPGELNALAGAVLAADEQMGAERKRFQEELRGTLSPKQFATFLLFERNFGRQVRDAVGEMYRNRRQRDRDE